MKNEKEVANMVTKRKFYFEWKEIGISYNSDNMGIPHIITIKSGRCDARKKFTLRLTDPKTIETVAIDFNTNLTERLAITGFLLNYERLSTPEMLYVLEYLIEVMPSTFAPYLIKFYEKTLPKNIRSGLTTFEEYKQAFRKIYRPINDIHDLIDHYKRLDKQSKCEILVKEITENFPDLLERNVESLIYCLYRLIHEDNEQKIIKVMLDSLIKTTGQKQIYHILRALLYIEAENREHCKTINGELSNLINNYGSKEDSEWELEIYLKTLLQSFPIASELEKIKPLLLALTVTGNDELKKMSKTLLKGFEKATTRQEAVDLILEEDSNLAYNWIMIVKQVIEKW